MGKANSILIEYARTRLYPYMRKYSPKGYSDFVRKINNGTYKVSDFLMPWKRYIKGRKRVPFRLRY